MIANTLPFRDRCLRSLAIALIVAVIAPSAYAADGDLDSTFGATGSGYTIIDFGNGSNGHQDGAHRLLRQSDGKFVAVGSVDSAYGLGHVGIGLARILNNGQIDTTFGDGVAPAGRSIVQPAAGEDITGNGIALLPSGEIVVAGTYFSPTPSGQLFGFPANGDGFWNVYDADGSAYNDVLALPDGRLLVGGAAPGASSRDYSLVLYDGAGAFIDHLTVPFNLGGSNNDQVQRITYVPAASASSGRLGYVYAIGSVALPNYASGHANIECGIVKAGLYSTMPKLRLEPGFGTGGKVKLDVNAAWLAGNSYAIDGNAYCRGLSVGKDGGLLIAGERYYFGENNDHATADDSFGFAAKLDANGVADLTFHNHSWGQGFAFYGLDGNFNANGYYVGFWFSLIQGNGMPLLGGLTIPPCGAGSLNRSWVLRTSASGSQDGAYTDWSCNAPRPTADTGFDVALDGVFDAGGVVTVGNVYSSLNPASATDFVFMRHQSDLIFTDNFDPGY